MNDAHTRQTTENEAPPARVKLRGSTLLGPLPVTLVTTGTMERSGVLTVAWTGVTSTKPPTLSVSVRPERYSYGLLKESGEFVVHPVPRSLARTADWCGMVSGRDRDKFAESRPPLEKTASVEVAAPTLAACPVALECRVRQIIPLGSHDLFLADILTVTVHETLLDRTGKLRLDRADLLAFAHGEYYPLGKTVGSFGFSVRKRK